MTKPASIVPAEARGKVNAGRALLVSAYDDESDLRKIRLEGAISLGELKKKVPTLEKEQEIIFYCA